MDVDCFALGNAFEFAEQKAGLDRLFAHEADEDNGNGAEQVAQETQEAAESEAAATDEAPKEEVEAAGAEEPAGENLPEEPVEVVAEETEDLEIVEDEGKTGSEGEEESEENKVKLASAIPDLDENAPADAENAEGQAVQAPQSAGVYALVDIGAQKTNINIMNGNISCFTREVYIGGEDMTEAVAKHLGISAVEAEAVKRSGEQEAAVLEAVGQTLDDLANEIFLSFDYFENQFESEIGAVYVSGGGARLKGIAPVLGETLGRRVSTWNPTAGMEVSLSDRQASKLRENAPQLAVVMGLASRLRKV